MLYDGEIERTIPPRSGRNQVLALARAPAPPADGGRGDHRPARAARRRRRASCGAARSSCSISDFISEPGWERPLLRLTERHEVVAIRLVDPREYELPDAGLIVVEDAETGEQLLVDSSDPEFRRRLRAAAERARPSLRARSARAGIDLHVVSTTTISSARSCGSSEPRRGGAPMTFASPWMLLRSSRAFRSLVLAYVGAVSGAVRAGGPRSPSEGLVADRPRGGGGPGAATFPFALFAAALALLVRRARPADGDAWRCRSARAR